MMRRVVAIVLSTVVAAGAGVVTNVFTDGWGWTWGVALGVLVAGQAGSQVWLGRLNRQERPPVPGAAVGGPVTGSTVVLGGRAVGRVEGGTVVTGDDNVVRGRGLDRR